MDRWPTEFTVEDVRCFQGAESGQIRPITLLIGENSTGKSTFLGCYAAIHRLLSPLFFLDFEADFNEDPFPMGSFREIVRARRGRAGRINEFKLGFGFKSGRQPIRSVTTCFREEGSQPMVDVLRYELGDAHVEVQRVSADASKLVTPLGQTTVPYRFGHAVTLLDRASRFRSESPLKDNVQHYVDNFVRRWSGRKNRRPRLSTVTANPLRAVAPLRAKPQRTYDPVRETASPEGAHVPMLMMRLHRTDKGEWGELHDDLVAFGRESGMFSDIRVKAHGRQMSDPFGLQVKVRSGSHANIIDVGYGVSQSLPILVDVLSVPQQQGFILQQPEVHLHPRGQAELATFFVDSVRQRGKRFLIETHSDHIVDRVRIHVRRGDLSADDVSLLYFQPHRNAVRICNITLDEHGNLKEVPEGYREFFARETDRLLGFED